MSRGTATKVAVVAGAVRYAQEWGAIAAICGQARRGEVAVCAGGGAWQAVAVGKGCRRLGSAGGGEKLYMSCVVVMAVRCTGQWEWW